MPWTQSTIGFLVIGTILLVGCQPDTAYKAPPPPTVTIAKPTIETVPIFLEENGETEAVEQAIVQSRVRGVLGELLVDPNSRVIKDETILFQINPEEYDAALASAEAEVNSAKAELAKAKAEIDVANAAIDGSDANIRVNQAEADRMKLLIDSRAVSKSEYEEVLARLETSTASKKASLASLSTAKAAVTNAEAKVKKAQAERDQAQLNKDWTTIKAPISGRITKTLVKQGNVVEDGTELIEIVKNDPIWANFNINERFLLSLERESKVDENDERDLSKIKVQLKRSGDVGFPFEGHLDYYDPKVDQNTGTMQLRAVFDNNHENDKLLLPGLFVRVRLMIGQYDDAILVPERAIGRDQVGAYVFAVDAERKAARKPVVLGPKHNGLIVIESGLDQNDSVIVDGIQRVRDGAEVTSEN